MADIGLNPPYAGNKHSFTGTATVTGIKRGMVVVAAGTNHADVKLPAGAADKAVMGVVTDQGDPNNSDQFAIGDTFSVRDDGDVEVLLDTGLTVAVDDMLITGATAGTVKVVAAEGAPYDVVGRALQAFVNDTGAPALISCRLGIARRFS